MEKTIQTFTEYHIRNRHNISIMPHEEEYPILHNHTYYEIQIQTKGSILHHYGNSIETIYEGDLLLIAPNLMHCIKKSNDTEFQYLNLAVSTPIFLSIIDFLNVEILNNFIKQTNPFLKIHLSGSQLKKIIKKYQQVESLPNHDDAKYISSLKFFLIYILEYFHKEINLSHTRLPDWLIDFLNSLNNPELYQWQIKDLAKLTFYSHNYLCYLFKKYMGVTLQHYFTQLKMNYAAFLLRTSTHTISYIAQQVGFDNQGHFATIFRKQFYDTPITYRKKNQIKNIHAPQNKLD